MRTSRHYKALLSIFMEESERLRKAAMGAAEAETVNYYSDMHLYMRCIYIEIAEITLNEHEKTLFLKRVQDCSTQMSALVGEFYMKMHENQKD